MQTSSSRDADRSLGYKLDRGVRGAKAGAAVGMLLGSLVYFLIAQWVPESAFGPIVLVSGATLAIVGGLFFPLDLAYHEWEEDSDNITPADRVRRLHGESQSRS